MPHHGKKTRYNRRIRQGSARLFDVDTVRVSEFIPEVRGSNRHTTATLDGRLPVEILVEIPGARGEDRLFEDWRWGPGAYDEDRWDTFVEDIKRNGIRDAVFLVVEPEAGSIYWTQVEVYEGNHRIRAAYQAGLRTVPVQVRFFGHTERLFDEMPWEYRPSVEAKILDYDQPSDAEFKRQWEITDVEGKVWGFRELRDYIAREGGWDREEIGALMAMGREGPMDGTQGMVPEALLYYFERVLG